MAIVKNPSSSKHLGRQVMTTQLPFAGIRVIEFAHFWSVPYGTMFLASQGADVIKVESVQRPDVWRANHTAPILGDR